MRRISWSFVATSCAVQGCLLAGALSAQDRREIQVDRDLTYAWSQHEMRTEYGLDVYVRPGLTGAPVVISLHGGSGSKDTPSYVEVSRRLAAEDLVVFNVTYPGGSPAGYLESDGELLRAALETVLCAARYVAERAPHYGGDPTNVLVLGHSAGGYMGLMISLLQGSLTDRWDSFASRRGSVIRPVECAVEGLAPAPTGFVGFNGAYFVFRFFGLPDRDPELWELLNPAEYVDLEPSLKTRFILGTEDATQPPAHLEMIAHFSEDRVLAGSDSRVAEVLATHAYSFERDSWSRTLRTILGLVRTPSVPAGAR